eukprot:342085-Pleurochrysis_carterae.AAC.2
MLREVFRISPRALLEEPAKSFDAIEKELDLPVSQLLALFNKVPARPTRQMLSSSLSPLLSHHTILRRAPMPPLQRLVATSVSSSWIFQLLLAAAAGLLVIRKIVAVLQSERERVAAIGAALAASRLNASARAAFVRDEGGKKSDARIFDWRNTLRHEAGGLICMGWREGSTVFVASLHPSCPQLQNLTLFCAHESSFLTEFGRVCADLPGPRAADEATAHMRPLEDELKGELEQGVLLFAWPNQLYKSSLYSTLFSFFPLEKVLAFLWTSAVFLLSARE